MDELEENHIRFRSFMHFDEFKEILNSVQSGDLSAIRLEIYDRKITELFNYYLEQPYLLDSHLKDMLTDCLNIVLNSRDKDPTLKHFIFRILFNIVKTRGYKHVIRLMPHAVVDLEPTLEMLRSEQPDDRSVYQTCYGLLLWLCIVISVPFDLDSMGDHNLPPISVRIYETALKYLVLRYKSQEPAAFLLSKFVSRPDMCERYFNKTIELCLNNIENAHDKMEHYELAGYLLYFCNLCKFSPREQLRPYLPKLHKMCKLQNDIASKNIITAHLLCKLMQRIAVSYCPPRQDCKWMYKKRRNVLAVNLKNLGTGDTYEIDQISNEDDSYDIPEEVADIVDFLLSALRSNFTKLRWSSAKGIARVSFLLPAEMVNDVLTAILGLANEYEPHYSWHGACLALGEMGRRGLLLPDRLPDVFNVIKRALFYDEKAGECTYGSNVRDAACYVCWAFARAFDSSHLAPYVTDFATVLLLVSLFDRNIGVRRAASAAFQENVGRQNKFPNGIEIITTCDYFSVGLLTKCYTNLTDFVAQFKVYVQPMLDFLTGSMCIGHWDAEIRSLSSQALRIVGPRDLKYISSKVLPDLFNKMNAPEFQMRVGSILGIAECIHLLGNDLITEDSKILDRLKNLIPELNSKRQFVGINGEFMKQATYAVIKNVSVVGFPIREDQNLLDSWRKFLQEGVDAVEVPVQKAAIDSFSAFLRQYVYLSSADQKDSINIQFKDSIIEDILKNLHPSKESVRIGALMMLTNCCDIICDGSSDSDKILQEILVCCDCNHHSPPDALFWVESRQQAFLCLRKFISCLLNHLKSKLTKEVIDKVFNAYILGFEDYTTDNKGDSGSRVRKSVMDNAIELICNFVDSGSLQLLNEENVNTIFMKCARQGVEKIDKVRGCGALNFYRLVTYKPEILCLTRRAEILKMFENFDADSSDERKWTSATETFPLFVQLLDFPEFQFEIMLGLVVSTCGQIKNTMEASRESFSNHITKRDPELAKNLFLHSLNLLKSNTENQRILIPLLSFIDYFLTEPVIVSSIDSENKDLIELYHTVRGIGLKTTLVSKLRNIISIFADLLQFISGEVFRLALKSLICLLCHKYPLIRKFTANKLFESLTLYAFIEDSVSCEHITEILLNTVWESDLKEVCERRNELCRLMNVEIPVRNSRQSR